MKKLLVAAIILTGLVWWFWGRTLEPVQVIRSQLAALQAGDDQQAYKYLSTDARRALPEDEFLALVEATPVVRQPWESTFLSRKVENQTATVSGHITGRDGHDYAVSYTLVRENDVWRIHGFQW